jgi:hypothetical protein
MSDKIRATLSQKGSSRLRSRVEQEDDLNVRSSLTIARRLEQFTNIDDTNLEGGSVLVYKEPTENWTATRDLNQQNVDGGEF